MLGHSTLLQPHSLCEGSTTEWSSRQREIAIHCAGTRVSRTASSSQHPHPDKVTRFFKLLSQCRKKAYACAQLASLIRPVLETEWSDRARSWVHLHAGAQRCVKDTGGPAPRSLLHPELATGSSVLRRLQNWTKESSGSKTSRIFRAALATSWQIPPRTGSI